MSAINEGFDNTSIKVPPKSKWKKHFAIKPVYIHGEKYWLTTVYKRFSVIRDEFYDVEYGTILDVIKTVENNNIGESQAWGG